MKEGDFIHIEDGLGPLNGQIINILDYDIVEVSVINYLLNDTFADGAPLSGIVLNLKNIKKVSIHETYEEIIEQYFDEFI